MDVDIDEGIKVGDVGYYFFQDYVGVEVIYGFDVVFEFGGFEFRVWVVFGFFQFIDDVGYGG